MNIQTVTAGVIGKISIKISMTRGCLKLPAKFILKTWHVYSCLYDEVCEDSVLGGMCPCHGNEDCSKLIESDCRSSSFAY